MISLDTNVLFYSLHPRLPEHQRARRVVHELQHSAGVVLCELVLLELYVLLRNPAVVSRPASAHDATAACLAYRHNPHWLLVESAPVMSDVWKHASHENFARRRIFDARLALTLRHHGVTELITRNVKHFLGFGFDRITDPFAAQ